MDSTDTGFHANNDLSAGLRRQIHQIPGKSVSGQLGLRTCLSEFHALWDYGFQPNIGGINLRSISESDRKFFGIAQN